MFKGLFVFSLLLLLPFKVKSQYFIEGQLEVSEGIENQYAYLSVIDKWNDFQKIQERFIVQSQKIDSSGYFQFEGKEFPDEKCFYRIHFAPKQNPTRIIGYPRNYFYFILSNRDSISLRINSISFAAVTTVHSTLLENNRLGELSTIIDSFRTMAFTASMSDEYLSQDTLDLYPNILISNPTVNDFMVNRLEMIQIKRQSQVLNFIENNDYPLLQLYAVHSGELDFNTHQTLYKKLANNLKKRAIDQKYAQSLDEFIAGNSFRETSKQNRFLKNVLMLSLFANSIFLTLFLLHKRRNKLASAKSQSSFDNLTSKEIQIVNLIYDHKTNKEIASQLSVSTSTVKTHINNIYRKLSINSRQALIANNI